MSVLRWEDPPPDGRAAGRQRRYTDHDQIAAVLRRHPRRWALIAMDLPTGIAAAINGGQHRAYRPGGTFEAAGRFQNGMTLTYVRFIGPADESPERPS